MSSSSGNFFRITSPLRGEFTGDRRIPLTKVSDTEIYDFFDLSLNKVNNRDAGNLIRHRAWYSCYLTSHLSVWTSIQQHISHLANLQKCASSLHIAMHYSDVVVIALYITQQPVQQVQPIHTYALVWDNALGHYLHVRYTANDSSLSVGYYHLKSPALVQCKGKVRVHRAIYVFVLKQQAVIGITRFTYIRWADWCYFTTHGELCYSTQPYIIMIYRGLDKMIDILQTIIWTRFLQQVIFCLKFLWSHFKMGAGNALALNRQQSNTWTNNDPVYWHTYTLRGLHWLFFFYSVHPVPCSCL